MNKVDRFRAVLEPRRVLRWIYPGRVSVATVSVVVTLLFTLVTDPVRTSIATVPFVTAMLLTAISFVRTEVNRVEPGPGFLYAQLVRHVNDDRRLDRRFRPEAYVVMAAGPFCEALRTAPLDSGRTLLDLSPPGVPVRTLLVHTP